MKNRLRISTIVAALVAIVLRADGLFAATISVDCSTGGAIQTAVDAANPGDTISVTGTCTENILIRNEKSRLTLDGNNKAATINGGTGSGVTAPAINVRGKGILIQGFNINGGLQGISVNRNSNAVVNNNSIAGAILAGIGIDDQSFAAITNNTITNNPAQAAINFGISVTGNSDARIGFNADTEVSPAPNTIQSSDIGVFVGYYSSAKIAGNTIAQNSGSGIIVGFFSHAELGGNDISANGDGIAVTDFGGVDLANTPVPVPLNSPNSSVTNNLRFGVFCAGGGYVAGNVGAINGDSSQKSIAANCLDLL